MVYLRQRCYLAATSQGTCVRSRHTLIYDEPRTVVSASVSFVFALAWNIIDTGTLRPPRFLHPNGADQRTGDNSRLLTGYGDSVGQHAVYIRQVHRREHRTRFMQFQEERVRTRNEIAYNLKLEAVPKESTYLFGRQLMEPLLLSLSTTDRIIAFCKLFIAQRFFINNAIRLA